MKGWKDYEFDSHNDKKKVEVDEKSVSENADFSAINNVLREIEDFNRKEREAMVKEEVVEEVFLKQEEVPIASCSQFQKDSEEVPVASSSGYQVQPERSLPVNNDYGVLCRHLQRHNQYLHFLTQEEILMVDFLFYDQYGDESILSLNPHHEPVYSKNFDKKSALRSDLLVDFDNNDGGYSVQLYKFDFITMPRSCWFSSGVIDGCSFMFNHDEDDAASGTKRFWFNISPFVSVFLLVLFHYDI